MQARQNGAVDTTARFAPQRPGASVEFDDLREAHRRQAHVIDTLSEAVSTLRNGAAALKADNVALRADNDRLQGRRAAVREDAEQVEFRFRRDARAPRAARAAVAGALGERVSVPALERAQLLASELTTNRVVHGGASGDEKLTLRVRIGDATARLEVDDRQVGELDCCSDLFLVDKLSQRWGVERAAGATRLWALLPVPASGATT